MMIHEVIDQVLHPERYHGATKRPPFFEGWYFKMVSPDRASRFAVIPGIFLSDHPDQHHAFVQIFDGVSGQATYHRFPAAQFQAARGYFDLQIGNNHFTLDGLHLDIDDDLRRVTGDLAFGKAIPWTVSLIEPGVMGWFGWMPFMECYHGILAFDHAVTGTLTVDGVAHRFDGGRGYIEKDWGKSFPGGWVWMQTNHFAQPGTSFAASVAITPFISLWFPGFLAGLWHDRTFYRFATYTGARTEMLTITEAAVTWVVGDRARRLEVYATRAEASLLPGPNRADMGTRVPETLKASIHIRLTERAGGVIFDDTGECAGLEVAGDVDKLLAAVQPVAVKV
ncbi:MAG: tocopherol cyclase family protein [Chloroflexota bacterium]|nr:tocopherol cyclase family protein [Chloroflexota bacterium]